MTQFISQSNRGWPGFNPSMAWVLQHAAAIRDARDKVKRQTYMKKNRAADLFHVIDGLL